MELRLRWEATLNRVYWSLVLAGSPITKPKMEKLLSSETKQKLEKDEKNIINYKNALSHIKANWMVTPKPVTLTSIKQLYDIACKPTASASSERTFNARKKDLTLFIEYLRTSNEHPIIQAGIAQIQMIEIAPFTEGNGRIARLLPYLYLYRAGYDFRGLLVFDEFLRRDLIALKQAIESVKTNKNLTLWLEYYTYGLVTQVTKTINDIETSKFGSSLPAVYWKLNERQKSIMEMLEPTGARITNKHVQKKFGVSQITASRDLTRLAKLNMVFSKGKGRSTFYIKAIAN